MISKYPLNVILSKISKLDSQNVTSDLSKYESEAKRKATPHLQFPLSKSVI